MITYRNNGAIGALLDEYERAVKDLQHIINNVSSEELSSIVDTDTEDPDCRSIQTILTHVLRSGYWYVIEVRKSLGEEVNFPTIEKTVTIEAFQKELNIMFQFNEQLFENHPTIKLEEFDPEKKIKVRWGQHYDVEQLFEHAIVHILRHRRQIERFLLKLR